MEKLVLTFTPEEISILSEGLVSLPYRVSANLIANLQKQINSQAQKKEEEVK